MKNAWKDFGCLDPNEVFNQPTVNYFIKYLNLCVLTSELGKTETELCKNVIESPNFQGVSTDESHPFYDLCIYLKMLNSIA